MASDRARNLAKLKTLQVSLFNLKVRFNRVSGVYEARDQKAQVIRENMELCILNAIETIDFFIKEVM